MSISRAFVTQGRTLFSHLFFSTLQWFKLLPAKWRHFSSFPSYMFHRLLWDCDLWFNTPQSGVTSSLQPACREFYNFHVIFSNSSKLQWIQNSPRVFLLLSQERVWWTNIALFCCKKIKPAHNLPSVLSPRPCVIVLKHPCSNTLQVFHWRPKYHLPLTSQRRWG